MAPLRSAARFQPKLPSPGHHGGVRVVAVVGRVDGWDVMGKAVWAETEPRSAAEP